MIDPDTGTCRLDLELRYVEINGHLAWINGLPVSEHIGERIGDILPQIAETVEPQLQHVIDSGEPVMYGLAYVETAAHPGEKRLYQHAYIPEKDQGKVVGVACMIRDITRQKLIEDIEGAEDELGVLRRRLRAEQHRVGASRYHLPRTR